MTLAVNPVLSLLAVSTSPVGAAGAAAGGRYVADDRTIPVTVADGALTLTFRTETDNAILNALTVIHSAPVTGLWGDLDGDGSLLLSDLQMLVRLLVGL